jgi:hypothetical protein
MRSDNVPWCSFFFDLEKVVVVAALLAIVLGHHVHRFNRSRRNQRDALDVFIEPFFQIAHPSLDIFSLGPPRFKELIFALKRDTGLEQIRKRHHPAPQQIENLRLETLGPIIFQIFLDSANMRVEVVHVPFEWFVRVAVIAGHEILR